MKRIEKRAKYSFYVIALVLALGIAFSSNGQNAVKPSIPKTIELTADSVLNISNLQAIKKIQVIGKPAILITNEDWIKNVQNLLLALHKNLTGEQSDAAIDLIKQFYGLTDKKL